MVIAQSHPARSAAPFGRRCRVDRPTVDKLVAYCPAVGKRAVCNQAVDRRVACFPAEGKQAVYSPVVDKQVEYYPVGDRRVVCNPVVDKQAADSPAVGKRFADWRAVYYLAGDKPAVPAVQTLGRIRPGVVVVEWFQVAQIRDWSRLGRMVDMCPDVSIRAVSLRARWHQAVWFRQAASSLVGAPRLWAPAPGRGAIPRGRAGALAAPRIAA